MSQMKRRKFLNRVIFTSPLEGVGLDLKNKAKKLHLQFCHPTADRLIDLLVKAGKTNSDVLEAIRTVTSQCDICIRNKSAPLRPIVGFPSKKTVNILEENLKYAL